LRREALSVVAVEAVGPYRLLRVGRGGLDPGEPGQFFMLRPPGHVLPRPMSLCLAPPRELAFLVDVVGPGTTALARLARGERADVFGPLGRGFRLDVARPLLVGGGVGIAPLPYLTEHLPDAPAVLGFRSAEHAEAAALLPGAEVVVEPRFVTEAIPAGHDVLACGPEPMLEAVAALAPGSQLAREAPMACGFGACYGCVVEIEGRLKRLCVEGPVLQSPVTAGHGRGRGSVTSERARTASHGSLVASARPNGRVQVGRVLPPSPGTAGGDTAA
jgi:dihydroorotate dehydrogenase electron transfer subunit